MRETFTAKGTLRLVRTRRKDCLVSIPAKHEGATTAGPFMSTAEFLAEMNGKIGKNSFYGLLHNGRIKSIRIGRKFLIPRSELTDFPAREAA